jgi:hypothetical protein
MSLDFYLKKVKETCVFDSNITHNLGPMANEAGIYTALWRPEEVKDNVVAADLIPILETGLAELKADPAHFKTFDSPNGWGKYEHFVPFVEEVLQACRDNPDARPRASR